MADDTARWMPAWLALLRTHARLWDQIEAQVRRDHGLTIARYDVLTHVDMAGGRLGLSKLASSIVLSPSGLSKLLDRMEASGLVRREADPRDARSTFAAITPQGRALVKKARRSHHEFLQQTLGDALDDHDVADLTRIMARIGASVSRHSPRVEASGGGIRVAGGLGSTRGTSTDPRPQDDPRAPATHDHLDSAS